MEKYDLSPIHQSLNIAKDLVILYILGQVSYMEEENDFSNNLPYIHSRHSVQLLSLRVDYV